jgi:hypothetical protein
MAVRTLTKMTEIEMSKHSLKYLQYKGFYCNFNCNYRIYSHISREILDKNWNFYLSFDLYAGQQKLEFQKYSMKVMQ